MSRSLVAPPAGKLFKWGDFAQFVGAVTLESEAAELRQSVSGTEFGRIDLSEADGKGSIEYLCSDSLRVIVFDCAFRGEHTFHVIDDGWIRLNFSLSISVDMAFGKRSSIPVLSPSWRFVSVPSDELTVESVAPGAALKWVTVCCRPETLGELADMVPDDLPLRESEHLPDADGFAYRPFKFTPALREATAEMINQRPQGGLRASYVASKAQELLILSLDYMFNQQSPDALSQHIRLNARDITALQMAREILDENLAHPPTVANLSQMVGLNRNKLFYGFKSLFGVSISEHLQEMRIVTGHRLLTTTDEPISEIAAAIGFRHQCNFSTAFRAHYGMTPSRLRARQGSAAAE
ncbi:MAG: AraC family transcriptional regulator [Rhizomicrobium sp.]